MLNEIFKSQENVEVFELPYSVADGQTSDDEDDDDESNDRPPNLITSMENHAGLSLSISPMPNRSNKALELMNMTDDYGGGGSIARNQQKKHRIMSLQKIASDNKRSSKVLLSNLDKNESTISF